MPFYPSVPVHLKVRWFWYLRVLKEFTPKKSRIWKVEFPFFVFRRSSQAGRDQRHIALVVNRYRVCGIRTFCPGRSSADALRDLMGNRATRSHLTPAAVLQREQDGLQLLRCIGGGAGCI